MTVRTESAHLPLELSKTECGRCSCIILYSSEKCILCDVALEILYTVISDFGLPPSVVRKVDVATGDDGCDLPPPVGLPAIRILAKCLHYPRFDSSILTNEFGRCVDRPGRDFLARRSAAGLPTAVVTPIG